MGSEPFPFASRASTRALVRRARRVRLLKLVLSGALLWYIVERISLRALWEALAGADMVLVGLGLAISGIGMAAAAVQLRVLGESQGIRLSGRDALALNLATSFYNLFLPGYIAGGVARWYRLARSHSAERPIAALAVILSSRVVELTSVLIAGLGFWAADPHARSNPVIPGIFAGLVVALGVLVHLVTDQHRKKSGPRRPPKSPFGAIVPAAWRAHVESGLGAAARFRDMPPGTLARLACASAARHLLMIAAFYCFARSLHLSVSIAVAGWTRTVVALAGMLPVTLGGLGVREGSLIAVLHPYGVPAPGAAALGLLLFGRELMAAVAGGILEARAFLSFGEPGPERRWGEIK
jgi:uncharacterized membrane protein YbhN (UPF0104 family)